MIAIIGGSVAAFVAYKTIKSIEPSVEVKIFSRESTKPYSKMLLPYVLTSSVEENMFFDLPYEDIFLDAQVVQLNSSTKELRDINGNVYSFEKAIIATGADAYVPEFKGNYDENKIISIRYLGDIVKVKECIKEAKLRRVVVLGAGLVSMEMGSALMMAGFKVIFVVGSNRILSQIMNKDAADFLEGVIRKRYPVEFFKQNDIEYAETCDGILKIKLRDGKEIECDFVVVGKGVRPNIGFLDDMIKINSAIEVDEYMRTSVKDVYAVGDVAASYDVVFRDKRTHAIWPVAVEQAKIAAKNVLGLNIKEKPEFSRNIVPVFGLNVFTGGASKLENYDEELEADDGESYRRLLVRDGMLDGFVIVGYVQNYGAYTFLARNRINVNNIKHKLLYGTVDVRRIQ